MKKAEPDWNRLLRKRPYGERMFTAQMWDQVEKRLQSPANSRRRSVRKGLYAGCAALIAGLVLLVGFLDVPALRPYGSGQLASLFEDRSPIVDKLTPEDLPLAGEPTFSQIIHVAANDGMARSSTMVMPTPIVIDPDYYDSREPARGDVVYFKTQPGGSNSVYEPYDLSRVIGMPGETVRLRDGQVYINGRKLEAFYGSAPRGREDLESWNTSMAEEVKLGEGQYFLLGDMWGHSYNDSQAAGGIDRSMILGKAVGYTKTAPEQDTDWVELYNKDDLRLLAAKPEGSLDTGLYQRIKVVWGDRSREFYWRSVTNETYAPEVYFADMDQDKAKDAVIVLTTAYGSGVHVTEPHIIRNNMTEIPVRNPIKETLGVAVSEVKVSNGQVDAMVTLDGQTITKQFKESDAGIWFDKLGLGSVISYRLDEENRLWADMAGFVSPGTVIAEISVRFDLRDREYVPVDYTMREVSE
ncbi:signal peptidase I [Paenibacillus spongiae]|uniref:Signal peptidase I n=1 Tax=Paenibacillus spongiae TaxID=2909671 RepID=A0ABY5SA60_9BACL|nr:signal peptidase I [Paenibacillus spongiae]UVI30821.1 signal peptidase I [Paenibacillus spongiae]